jgi:hypothetical protein
LTVVMMLIKWTWAECQWLETCVVHLYLQSSMDIVWVVLYDQSHGKCLHFELYFVSDDVNCIKGAIPDLDYTDIQKQYRLLPSNDTKISCKQPSAFHRIPNIKTCLTKYNPVQTIVRIFASSHLPLRFYVFINE